MLLYLKKIGERLIILSLILIIIVSGGLLIKISSEYAKDRVYYNELKKNNATIVNWEALKKINSQVVGWISINNTPIDYPIAQANDNEKYLNTLFNGDYGAAGSLFIDYRNDKEFKDYNTIIYGHRMNDNTMFNCLKKYRNKDFYNKHKVIDLKTPENNYILNIKAFLKVNSDSRLYNLNLESDKSKKKWLSEIKKEAIYIIGKLDTTNRYVMLSTCVKNEKDKRYLVLCEISK